MTPYPFAAHPRVRKATQAAIVAVISGISFQVPVAAAPDASETKVAVAVPLETQVVGGDEARRKLRDALIALNQAQLPDTVSPTSLFGIPLDDRAVVLKRIEELNASRDALSRRRIELSQRLEALESEARAAKKLPAPAPSKPPAESVPRQAAPATEGKEPAAEPDTESASAGDLGE